MVFSRFWGKALALGTAKIYLADLEKKVQGDLGLSRNSFFDGLVPGVFLMSFLIGLVADGWL